MKNFAIREPASRRAAAVCLYGMAAAALASGAEAWAAALTASSNVPLVQFDATDVTPTDRAAQVEANIPDTADPDRFSFEIEGRTDSVEVIDIDTDQSGNDSIVVDILGDVILGGFSLWIDRSAGFVGIGTGHPGPDAELHIEDVSPALRLVDESFGGNAGLELVDATDQLLIEGASGQDIVAIDTLANDTSLYIDPDGLVGLGTDAPDAGLHIENSIGATQLLIEETAANTTQTLVQLTNNGRPQIRLTNTDSSVNWVTGMGTEDAYILRRGSFEYRFTKGGRVRWFVPGDANPRFDFNNNGNLTLAGTLTENSDVNAKRDIVPVDGAEILDRVATLPISTWTYKADDSRARHLGPMAQDFHAAFGLGEDDRHISPRDVAGVALAAARELRRLIGQGDDHLRQARQESDAAIAALNARLAALEAEAER